MRSQPNARGADQAPVDALIRTRYTLDVCRVCGQERVHTPIQEPSCPECGGSARRSFALFPALREVQR
jgi:rRNA maturation protein Nop10